jgi:hypothetical protein
MIEFLARNCLPIVLVYAVAVLATTYSGLRSVHKDRRE